MGNVFGYMRISTAEDRELQKFNRQKNALEKYAANNGLEYTLMVQEDKSGKNFEDRKEWQKLERLLRSGDTLIIKDVSRFSRNTEQGYQKYMELMEKGVEVNFIDNMTISTPYIKQLLHIAEEQNIVAKTSLESTVKLLLIVEMDRAEQERKITVQRIKDGIKASDKKQGRRTGKLDKMTPELEHDIKAYLQNRGIKQVDLMRKHNISRNTLKKYIAIVEKHF